eukprot:TRINITY_DN18886_c0_g1_i1.p1 TRINITY_DN18886_c0_g1~~TRINITY_DN18886_c0_g1_i1.p1  ORF type:complete len:394 (+),score=115.41 TRINITY_DN18886_c0_g1_i1:79-1182(+)
MPRGWNDDLTRTASDDRADRLRRSERYRGLLRTAAALLVVGGLSVACLAFGIYTFTAKGLDNARLERVAAFNAAVERWERAGARDAFASLGALSLHGLPDAAGHVELRAATDGDSLLDHHHDLSDYRPLRYEYKGSLLFGTQHGKVSPWREITADPQCGIGNSTELFPLAHEPVQLSTVHSFPDGNWKDCDFRHHGTLMTSQHVCNVYFRAAGLCFRLQQQGGQWRPADKAGCYSPHYSPVHRSVKERVGRTNSPPPELYLEGSAVVVRSADDPYLAAYNITGGTLAFGQTHNERIKSSIVFIVIGSVATFATLAVALCNARDVCCPHPPQPLRAEPAKAYGRGRQSSTAEDSGAAGQEMRLRGVDV